MKIINGNGHDYKLILICALNLCDFMYIRTHLRLSALAAAQILISSSIELERTHIVLVVAIEVSWLMQLVQALMSSPPLRSDLGMCAPERTDVQGRSAPAL